ncbi:hypothetical protein BH24ACT4_BH24ACT4_25800 [soil metagenome]
MVGTHLASFEQLRHMRRILLKLGRDRDGTAAGQGWDRI